MTREDFSAACTIKNAETEWKAVHRRKLPRARLRRQIHSPDHALV